MTDQLKKWTVAQTSAGQKVSDSWQKYFKAERNDSISRAEEITQTARIQEVQDNTSWNCLEWTTWSASPQV